MIKISESTVDTQVINEMFNDATTGLQLVRVALENAYAKNQSNWSANNLGNMVTALNKLEQFRTFMIRTNANSNVRELILSDVQQFLKELNHEV